MSQPEANLEFEALLDYLKYNRGCDLTGYKHSTLIRRFGYRMQNLRIDSYSSYLQYLQHHPEEYLSLLNDVLINFTSFFRDQEAWNYLATAIIPKIISTQRSDEPIRVWSAGCAAGQEIYSLLILLAEALGMESLVERVQGYATDADEDALKQARRGTYNELEMTGMPAEWRQKYFEHTEQGYAVHPSLRHRIIFGRHDLTKDAPMPKIDLLICRNVLIYFNPEAQAAILARFHFSLKNTGFLFLGKSEALVNRRQIFTPIYMKHRIYTKGLKLELADHLSIAPKSHQKRPIEPLTAQDYFWRTAFESNPVAQFAVDLNGSLISASKQANLLFCLTLDDWSCLFQDLEPGRLIAAHTALDTFYQNRRSVLLKNIERNTSQGKQYFDVAIAPVLNARNQLLGSIVTFFDRTECEQLSEKLKDADTELRRVSGVLQATEMELDATHQELKLLEEDIHYKN